MSDDATTLGASEEVSQVKVPAAINRRAVIMAEIIANAAAERRADDEAMQANVVPDEVEEVAPIRDDEDGAKVAAPVVEQSSVVQEAVPTDELVRIVVDGEERDVPLSQVRDAGIRTLQKQSAADKRLEDATRLLREAQAVADQQVRPSDETADAGESSPGKDADDEIKKLAYAIQMGDEEESAAALRKVLKMAAMSPEAIDKAVEQKLQTREIVSRFEAPVDKGGFADIWSDPILKQKAIEESNRLLNEGSPNTWDTYKKAGDSVRQWLREKAGVIAGNGGEKSVPEQMTPTIEVSNEKKDKKTIDSLVGIGGTVETKQTAKPRSPQEIIAEIRRMRGQP